MIISILILSIVIIYNLTKKNETPNKEENITSRQNIFIYGDWDNNIIINKDKKVLVQIPVYDFNNEINKLHTNVSIDNFKIGSIDDIKFVNEEKHSSFNYYTLQFYMNFKEVGEFKLDNLIVNINTNNGSYSQNIGNYNIKVVDSLNTKNELEIVGGTALEPLNRSKNEGMVDYSVYYDIKNNSDHEVVISNIKLNTSDDIKVKNKIEPVKIQPSETKKVSFVASLNHKIVNTLLIPEIQYKILDNRSSIYGDQILITDPVSYERLSELVK